MGFLVALGYHPLHSNHRELPVQERKHAKLKLLSHLVVQPLARKAIGRKNTF